jgi:hypothetical protein
LEEETARALGGEKTPASGSKGVKGDVRVRGRFLVECKLSGEHHPDLGYYITLECQWLETIGNQAAKEHLIPLLVVEVATGKRAALIPLCRAKELGIGKEFPIIAVIEGRSYRLHPEFHAEALSLPELRIEAKRWAILTWEDLWELGDRVRAEQKQNRAAPKWFPGRKRLLNKKGFRRQ